MKRFVTAVLFAAATIALPSPVAAGEPLAVTCDYNGQTHEVTITALGNGSLNIARLANGHILVTFLWCDNAATVTNTDKIIVSGDDGLQSLFIDLANGGYRPGFTNEPGTSDEIEFNINLGGNFDLVEFEGDSSVQKIDMGQNNSQLLVVQKLNLNAGESTGIDADVSLVNVETVSVFARGGDDVIRARGGAGTGPDPFSLFLSIYAGKGNDTIKGGTDGDYLWADAGKDKVWGYEGNDEIHLDEGTGGDVGHTGIGNDTCTVDLGGSCD